MTSAIVFISCDESMPATEVVQMVTGELPESSERPGYTMYPWHLSTKYYDVDVELVLPARRESNRDLASRTEAVVLFFDGAGKDLAEVDAWMPIINEMSPEVRVLACNKCKESGITYERAQRWCLKEKFELVEVDAAPEEDEEFPESMGAARIKSALSAHVWPTLRMKDDSQAPPRDGEAAGLADMLETDGPLDFGGLFSQLADMKERAASLPQAERRKFAEKVVRAYWAAIGGDSDELDPSDSDDIDSDADYNSLA